MHIQRHFDRDIEEIKDLLLRMGAMVEDSIQQSIRALMDRDPAIAGQVIASDDRIDRMEVQIDQLVLELIAKMQPAAADLRFVAAVMKITPELERIADLAQDVCERVLELVREPQIQPLVHLPRLAGDAQMMVRHALDAFVRGDAKLAREVIRQDEAVDEDPRYISPAIRLTFIGKYFERMADGATNICEMVVYLVEGTMIKHSSAPLV